MADPGLLQALDYILNQSDESTIEVLAEAVVRRRRDMSLFSAVGNMPDPHKMAKELTDKIDTGINSGIESMRKMIRDMIIRIVREHAPELNDSQIDELCEAWLPGADGNKKNDLPSEMLLSMIEQFISFSNGTMKKSVDEELRKEMSDWTQRYWNAFPPVIRQLISDYLKNKIPEKEFKSKIVIALG
jgi:hypothetical protein